MESYPFYMIKSFKHNGHLHRIWFKNWRVPPEHLFPEHAAGSMIVLVNSHTRIQEADRKEWVSRVPSVAFFLPGEWYNIIALIEERGVRYYCNIASPFYVNENTITYIDYDLDVIRTSSGEVQIVDQEEYELHKVSYHYSQVVDEKVKAGLGGLMQRIRKGNPPFQDELVLAYYELWKNSTQTEV